MATIIDMPKLSDTMTVGTLVRWLKNEGDTIQSGDMIAEVETDKATMELENFEDGVLLKRYVEEGAQVQIGTAICAVGEAGETAPDAPTTSAAPEAQAATPTPEPSPVVAQAPTATTSAPASNGRVMASPLAKRIAEDTGVALQNIQGSGPHGRIVKADVLAASQNPSAAAPVASAPAPQVSTLAQASIPVSNMRATIARRLVESKTQVPHFYLETEADAAALLTTRAQINKRLAELSAEQGGGIKLTVNDLILKAAAEALVKVPAANASWMGSTIEQHGSVHLAFGVAIDDGLVTPVIRDAQTKTLRQISIEAKELIALARARKLKPEQMTGSTFTVTNLGMFGITKFFGIINPPNAGILSIGATITKPVVNEDNQIVIGKRMSLGFSGDHRVADGAVAATFLSTLKDMLEAPSLLLWQGV
tara:strand:- start:49697 stop:50962 length:1266 start_codon:yes stop_codon:yes gene_type:complete